MTRTTLPSPAHPHRSPSARYRNQTPSKSTVRDDIMASQLSQILESIEEAFDSPLLKQVDYRSVLLYTVLFFFVVEEYLRLRKRTALKKGYVPELKGVVTEEDYKKSHDYNMYKNNFGFLTDTFNSNQYAGNVLLASSVELSSGIVANSALAQVCFFIVYHVD